MKEFKYKTYNPQMTKLETVLTTEPIENDWELVKVIPVTQYEWVAMFLKNDEINDVLIK